MMIRFVLVRLPRFLSVFLPTSTRYSSACYYFCWRVIHAVLESGVSRDSLAIISLELEDSCIDVLGTEGDFWKELD